MFLNSSELDKYKIEEWTTIPSFYEKLKNEKELLMKSYGFMSHKRESQFDNFFGYYLLGVNDKMFGFCGESLKNQKVVENEALNFKSIYEFDLEILNCQDFIGDEANYYKPFEAELSIEMKVYQYSDEEKILISKKGQGNIDLYSSYQVKTSTNQFSAKIHPSAFTAAKHTAMTKMLEQRIQNLKNNKS